MKLRLPEPGEEAVGRRKVGQPSTALWRSAEPSCFLFAHLALTLAAQLSVSGPLSLLRSCEPPRCALDSAEAAVLLSGAKSLGPKEQRLQCRNLFYYYW